MKKTEELGISPTPWEITCEDYNDGRVWSVEAHDGAGITEFDCNEEQFGFEEGFANAHLIVAAPNMYKTEYDLVDVIERLMNGFAGTCETPSQDDVVAALDAAKKALSKAAGEEVKDGE